MPWDIPETLTQAFKVIQNIFTAISADEETKRLENQKAKERYQNEKDARSFAARMRRWLSGLKMILLMFTLMLTSCAHQPLTTDEREYLLDKLQECQKDRAELKDHLLECLDHLDKLQKCDIDLSPYSASCY